MPAARLLSSKIYFPKKGDVLDTDFSSVAERIHTLMDEKTGKRIKYCVLVGRHPDLGDEPIVETFVQNSSRFRKFLKQVNVIWRESEGEMRRYDRNRNGNFEEL